MKTVTFSTALGTCGILWEAEAVTGFRLPDDRADLSKVPEIQDLARAPEWVRGLAQRVQKHLGGEPQDFSDVPYDFAKVSTFQRAVYQAALTVKSGQTRTYGWIAAQIGQPVTVSRAVGTALGQNPWPLLVPCHRFVGANGKMTGFSGPGGIQTKLRLLAIEGSQLNLQ
jgi:methylated-DNA-[protein]-cysteine S-methyltransferase